MCCICSIFLLCCSISIIESNPPFPTTPNEFWNFALKQEYYAPGHIFLGAVLLPEFRRPGGSFIKTGPFLGGLAAQVGIRDGSGQFSTGSNSRRKRSPQQGTKSGSRNGFGDERSGRGFGFPGFQTKSSSSSSSQSEMNEQKDSQKQTPNSRAVQLLLRVMDFTFVNLDGTIVIEFDRDRPPAPPGVLATLNPERVFAKFEMDFGNPMGWAMVSGAYSSNPKEFLHDHLQLFYPALIELNFNIKIQPMPVQGNKLLYDILSNNTLKNKDIVTLLAPNATNFPPPELGFHSKNKIELVDVTDNETEVVIHKWEMQVTHTDDEKFCQSVMSSKLTANALKEIFDKLGRTENGQPIFLGINTTKPARGTTGGKCDEIDMTSLSIYQDYQDAKRAQYNESGQPKEYVNMDEAKATKDKLVIVNKKPYYRNSTKEGFKEAPEGEEDARKESSTKSAGTDDYYDVKKTQYSEVGQPREYENMDKAKTTNEKLVIVNKKVYYRNSATDEFKEAPEGKDNAMQNTYTKSEKKSCNTTTDNNGNSTTTVVTKTKNTAVNEDGKTTTTEEKKEKNSGDKRITGESGGDDK